MEIDEEARSTQKNRRQHKDRSSIRHKSRLRKDAVEDGSNQGYREDIKAKKKRPEEEHRHAEVDQRAGGSAKDAGSRFGSNAEYRFRKKRKGDPEGKKF